MELVTPGLVFILAILAIIMGLAFTGWWAAGLLAIRSRRAEAELPEIDIPGGFREKMGGVPPVIVSLLVFVGITLVAYVSGMLAYGGELLNERHVDRGNPWLVGGYLAPALVVLFTIFWVMMSYWLIGWRSRDWEFGSVPYVPGQSYFTTSFPSGPPPKQVELPQTGGAHRAR